MFAFFRPIFPNIESVFFSIFHFFDMGLGFDKISFRAVHKRLQAFFGFLDPLYTRPGFAYTFTTMVRPVR